MFLGFWIWDKDKMYCDCRMPHHILLYSLLANRKQTGPVIMLNTVRKQNNGNVYGFVVHTNLRCLQMHKLIETWAY